MSVETSHSKITRVLLLSFAAPLAYSFIEPWRLVVRQHRVVLPGLPLEADGLRIAQLSDLHCSAITPANLVRRAIATCNAEQPDVVVLTGDYVSRRNSYAKITLARLWARPLATYATEVADILARLKAPEGVFAIPGNHDHSQQGFAFVGQLLRAAGITTLVNASTLLRGGLPLIGLDDLRAGRPLVQRACAGIAPDAAHVILAHNPRLVWRVADRNCVMLAGHTHGGQVHLPFTNFRRRPHDVEGTNWHEGWYRVGSAQLYVSAGIGSVHFPMRFRCPPEINVFTLVRQ